MIPLTHHETRHAWHRLGTQEFPARVAAGALCILPVAAYRDGPEGQPLDAEERLCGEVLAQALELLPADRPCLMMPPLRQVPLQEAGQVLTVDMELASVLAEEQIRTAARSGFRSFCFVHAGEALTDWLDGLGRDLRVDGGLRMYRIGLPALGLSVGQAVTPAQAEALAALLRAVWDAGALP